VSARQRDEPDRAGTARVFTHNHLSHLPLSHYPHLSTPQTFPTGQATCRKCEAGTFQASRGQQECEASSRGFTLTLTLTLTLTPTPNLTLTLTLTLGLRARWLLHQGCVLADTMRGGSLRQQDQPEKPARLLLLRAWALVPGRRQGTDAVHSWQHRAGGPIP
jgi:hypothetical protein